MIDSSTSFSGDLNTRIIKAPKTHTAHSFRVPRLGRFIFTRDQGDSNIFSREVFMSNLRALHRRNSDIVGQYDLGSGLVTTTGVRLLSQDTAVTAGTATMAAIKNHGVGTGTTAAAVTDTALQTAIGTTATVGSNTNALASPNATVTSVATVAFAGTFAVTEWGLFNQSTLAGATMWDHKVFAALNVVSGDSIMFTYTLQLTAGG